MLSHVTVPRAEEYARHPSLTACLGECNGAVWDSEGLHFSLKLHEAAWNVSNGAHQQEVTSCGVMSVNYTQRAPMHTAGCTPPTPTVRVLSMFHLFLSVHLRLKFIHKAICLMILHEDRFIWRNEAWQPFILKLIWHKLPYIHEMMLCVAIWD